MGHACTATQSVLPSPSGSHSASLASAAADTGPSAILAELRRRQVMPVAATTALLLLLLLLWLLWLLLPLLLGLFVGLGASGGR